MSSSGVSTFNPQVSEIVLLAYSRCKVKRADITPDHLADARMEINLLLSEWANDQPHLWEVDLQTIPLVGAQNTYELPPDTILVLDAYYRYAGTSGTNANGWGEAGWGQGGWGSNGNVTGSVPTDRILWSVSRSEYAAYPDKLRQAQPTVFWFNRIDPPQIVTYPTPPVGTTDQILYYRVKRIDDAFAQGGQTLDVTYRYLAALADGLTANLAITYAPDQVAARAAKYMNSLKSAKRQDREQAPLRIVPMCGSYFRGAC